MATIPESPSNSSIADTLRAMAKTQCDRALYPDEVAACLAGAAAWEIVQQLANAPRATAMSKEDALRRWDEFRLQARTLVHPDR